MAADKMPNFEIPEQMRTFAEQSVDQAKKAFDDFMSATQKAVSKVEGSTSDAQAGAHDLNRKVLSYAEENMMAAFEHAQKLIKAKDVQDIMKLQNDFLKSQMASLGEQSRVISDAAAKAATEMTKGAAKG